MPNLEHPAYPAATLLQLESLVPCRESQVSILLSIFGEVVLFCIVCLNRTKIFWCLRGKSRYLRVFLWCHYEPALIVSVLVGFFLFCFCYLSLTLVFGR